jgi:hypothetical protein
MADDLIRRYQKYMWAFGWEDITAALNYYEKLARFYADLMGPALGSPPIWWHRRI